MDTLQNIEMNNKEFKEWLKKAEDALMCKASNAMYEGWNVNIKALTRILEAIDKLKEARIYA